MEICVLWFVWWLGFLSRDDDFPPPCCWSSFVTVTVLEPAPPATMAAGAGVNDRSALIDCGWPSLDELSSSFEGMVSRRFSRLGETELQKRLAKLDTMLPRSYGLMWRLFLKASLI